MARLGLFLIWCVMLAGLGLLIGAAALVGWVAYG